MFSELNSNLNWPEGHVPKGSMVFIKDRAESEGAFLLHHFLFAHLKANKHACLVGLEQSLFHFTSVGKKLAVNLQGVHAKGKLTFINALSTPYSWTKQTSSPAQPKDTKASTQQPSAIETLNFSLASESDTPLKELYQMIARALFGNRPPTTSETDNNSGFAIIIDSISPLLNSCPPIHVLDFIHYLHLLVQNKGGCLVILAHADTEEDPSILNAIEHKADLSFSIESLASGYSKEVHGQIMAVQTQGNQRQLLHFKLQDNAVRFTAKGATH